MPINRMKTLRKNLTTHLSDYSGIVPNLHREGRAEEDCRMKIVEVMKRLVGQQLIRADESSSHVIPHRDDT
jgi:hypothetical protein